MKTILMIMVVGVMVCGASKCEDGGGDNYNTYDGGVGDSGGDADSDTDTGEDTDSTPNCDWSCHYGDGCQDGYVHCDGQSCPNIAGMFGECCGPDWEC